MPVRIRNMTDEEFETYYRWSIDNNAAELMEDSNLSWEDAVKVSIEEIAQMLPNGLHTESNDLMTIEKNDSQEIIGFIWTLHEQTNGKKQSFLCDFVIFESHRRKGYGAKALALMARSAQNAGCQESVLFVTDRNVAARALYQKCGYQFLKQIDHGEYMIKQLC